MKKLTAFLSTMFLFCMLATAANGQIIVGNYTATSFQSGAVLPTSCSGSAIFTLTTTWIPYFCNGGTYTAFGVGGVGISGVTAGTGLTGGGTSGNVTVSLSAPVSEANGGTGNTSGQAASATSVAGGSAGAQPYQTAASTTAFVFPATDANALNLDGNRTDSYTPDGTSERPYKSLTQLVSGMAGVTGAYLIACNPTTAAYTYTGAVAFPSYQGTIIGNGCSWNITGNVSVPGVYFISNLYTTITGTLSYTGSTTAEKVRLGGSLIVSGGITTSGYDHFFDMSILSNTVINIAVGSTPVFTNVVGTPRFKSASGSTSATVLTIIDSQSLASGAYTNVDMSNGGLAVIRGFIATNNGTLVNINLSGSSGTSTTTANSLASVSAAWVAAGTAYTYVDNGSLYGLLTGSNLLTPNGLGMSAPAANTMTVKSGTTGAATFDSGTTGTVGVGTGANAKTVTIGNSTGATSLVLNAGTAGVSGSVVSTDGAMTANSNTLLPSQKAVVTYVGNKVNGLAWRPAVQHLDSATTAPGTAIVGQTSYTSDGFALANSDRILFTNASSGTYLNKVYTVAGVGTSITLTLATDGQSGTGAPANGDALYVTQGTANGGKIFVYNSTSATWVQASSPSGTLLSSNNLNDVTSVTTSRTNLGAAASGANSDITSLTGLTTALPVSEGGTGAATAAAYSFFGNSSSSTAAPSFTATPVVTTLTANGGANIAIVGNSTSGAGVSGNSTGNYGGIFSGSYGVEGISANGSGYGVYGTSTSNYGVFGLSVSGVGVIGQQDGALTANTTQPVLYGVRSSTLGSYTSTGAIIRGEDLSASTGNLLELVKQSSTLFYVSSTGNIVGTGTLSITPSTTSLAAITGTSTSNRGVYGVSGSSTGVDGESTSGTGVYGGSSSGAGVYGISISSNGVYGAGSTSASTGVQGMSLLGVGGAFFQQGALTASALQPVLLARRDSTLGSYTSTGAIIRGEDTTASTGNLLDLVKQGTTVASVDQHGTFHQAGYYSALAGSFNSIADTAGNFQWVEFSDGAISTATGGVGFGDYQGDAQIWSNSTSTWTKAASFNGTRTALYGNVTIGSATSSAWGSAYNVLDLNSYGVLVGSYNGAGWTGTSYGQSEWGQNTYFTGNTSYAVGTGNASTILQSAGQLEFANAPSVSAGAAQTFTARFDIFPSGNVSIGSATDNGYRLFVTDGTMAVKTPLTGPLIYAVQEGTSYSSSTVSAAIIAQTKGTGSNYLFSGLNSAGTAVFTVDSSGGASFAGNVQVTNGSNQVYRCTTAGSIRVGQLTTVSSDCGASTATGLYVP